jgi:hypothetical protein
MARYGIPTGAAINTAGALWSGWDATANRALTLRAAAVQAYQDDLNRLYSTIFGGLASLRNQRAQAKAQAKQSSGWGALGGAGGGAIIGGLVGGPAGAALGAGLGGAAGQVIDAEVSGSGGGGTQAANTFTSTLQSYYQAQQLRGPNIWATPPQSMPIPSFAGPQYGR